MIQYTTRLLTTGADAYGKSPTVCFEKPKDCAALDALVAKIREKAGYVTWSVSLPHRPRSTGPGSASAHFHGHCQLIANETGNDFEDVKLALKRRAIRRGYPIQHKKDGGVRYSLVDGLPLPQSEADASVEQENMLIEESHQLAAELDVRLIEGEE